MKTVWKKHITNFRKQDTKAREEYMKRIILKEDRMRVIEGITYSYKIKYAGEKRWGNPEQLLTGYHFFILQRKYKKTWKNVEGFQGNIKEGIYRYYVYEGLTLTKYRVSYTSALNFFKKRTGLSIKNSYKEIKKYASEVLGIEIPQKKER